MKKLIFTLTLLIGTQSFAQFRDYNGLRSMLTATQELSAQINMMLGTTMSAEKGDREAICYALGTTASSRAQLRTKAAMLGAYSQQFLMSLDQVNRQAEFLAQQLCARFASLGSANLPGPAAHGQKAKLARGAITQAVQAMQYQMGTLSSMVQAGITN